MLSPFLSIKGQNQQSVYRFDTVGKQKSLQVIALPVVFYTPETSVGFGGGAQIFLLRQSNVYNSRLSNVFVSAIYTLNKQFVFEAKPQIYIGRGDYFLDMAYKYQVFPNSFWGIGNETPESNEETYNMTSNKLRIALLRRLQDVLNFGFELTYEYHNVTEVEEGGILESETVLGSDEARVSGLGIVFNLDSRDQVEGPTIGHYLQFNARFSSELFGGTQGWNKYIIDLRTYRPLGEKSVLALQVYGESTYGDVPFQAQATYGGGERARGYFRGRFIDNHMYVIQAEYRWRFKPRWVLAAFALAGEVADLPRNFFSDLKPSFGGGIRFQLTKSQKTLLRADVGFGKDGQGGFYFGVNEAF